MAKSVIVGNVLPLVLFLAVWVLCGKKVESQVNPGLQLCVSQRGLDYAGEVAVDLLYAEAQKIKISDQSGSAKTIIGNVNYEAKNIQVTSVVKPLSSVVSSPGSITWTLANAGISLEGNWAYNYKKLFIRIRDSGSFTGSVSGASISLSANLGLDATGHPTISTTSCTCTISSVSIKLRGGASWLYNLFTGFIEKQIRNQLETKICEAATKIINLNASELLTSFPLQETVNSDWLLDYRFLTAPEIINGNLCTKHKAGFYYKDDTTEPPFQAAPFPATIASNQMLTIWVSDYLLNTISYVLFKNGILKHTLTKNDLPPENKGFLNTTCTGFECFGALISKAAKAYPNAFVEMEMVVSSYPNASISSAGLKGTGVGTVTFRARLSNGSLVPLFKTNFSVAMSLTVSLNDTNLMGNITEIISVVNVTESQIGKIPDGFLTEVSKSIAKKYGKPRLNAILQKGIPIPSIKDVRFVNIRLENDDHCLRISTDVKNAGATTIN